MRIAMVTPSFPPNIGGLERHVSELCQFLSGAGHDVDVFTVASPDRHPSAHHGLQILESKNWSPSAHYHFAPGILTSLHRSTDSYDLVHAHGFHSLPAFMASFALRKPFVVTPHFHASGHTAVAKAVHKLYDVPAARIFTRAQAIVCCSYEERVILNSRYPGADDVTTVIYNGVDVEAIAKTRPLEISLPVLLVAGRLERYKNVDLAIRAFRLVRPGIAMLAVTGDGRDRRRLLRLSEELGFGDEFRLLGNVSSECLVQWQRTTRVAIALSSHEAFGLSVLEGALAGARVVASDIPAHREVAAMIEGRVRLVPLDITAADLAEVLEETIDADAPAIDLARIPTWEGMGARYETLYGSLVS